MALLPVYDWLGLDLTRRQKLAVNVLALGVVLGLILPGLSLATFNALPGTTQIIVGAMAIVAMWVIVVTVQDREASNLMWVVAAATAGFFLLDLLFVHPSIWENVPSLFYWVAKPFWVAVPMFAVAWWLMHSTSLTTRASLTVAGVAGIVVLQLYYTFVPIPTVSGESIQIGLVGNLVEGVPVHGAFLIVALAVVVLGMQVFGD